MQPPDLSQDPAFLALTAEVTGAVTHAAEFRITTIDERAAAAQECVRLNSIGARLEAKRKDITTPMDRAKQAVMDLFRPESERVTNAVAAIKRAMRVWDDEQERIRREEQRKAEERARLDREQAEREAAELAQRAEAERAAGNDRAAARLEGRAEAKIEKAATTVAPVHQADVPKVAGVSGREVWKFEVLDPNAVPREFLMVDEPKLRRYVSAMKGDSRVSGVRVYAERDYNVSRRGAA